MSKLILVGFNFLILFTYKIFFGGEVTIEQKMQPNIKPGESTIVELVITKGDREGFAKWQQVLPEGFIASAVETNGATFSYKNRNIKIIWMALPETETFSIKYKLEVSPEVQGDFNLKGKFSFIEENERRDVMSEMFILTVDENAVPVEMSDDISTLDSIVGSDTVISTIVDSMTTADDVEEIIEENTLTEQDSTEELIAKNTEEISAGDETKTPSIIDDNSVKTIALDAENISIEREIEYLDKGNYEVTLTVNKGALKSFGKVEEYLPPNFTASESENYGGRFSFEKKVMKILWMALPKEETFTVSYKMTSNSDELDSATVHGVFSFLNGDESEQVAMKATRFKNTMAEAGTPDVQIAEDPKKEDIQTDNVVEDIPTTMEKETKSEENLIQEITNVPSPETSVTYKVQIAAAKKEVQQQYFVDRHNITENVSIEYHETWYKYTVGSYNIYKAARDKRNKIWAERNKINDAFVTAYNEGERISVQEALMISNQKWFK